MIWLPSKKEIEILKIIHFFILVGAFRVAALELGPKQIRVNAVNPTVTMTAMAKVIILCHDFYCLFIF